MLCALSGINETGPYYMNTWQNTHIRQIRIPNPDKTELNKQVQKALGSQVNPLQSCSSSMPRFHSR